MNLAALSLRRPVTIVMFFISMVVFGLIATRLLRLESFPALDFPFVGVQVAYPNSSPEEVERSLTRPMEEALSTIGGIDQMFSNSGGDGVFIGMLFKQGENPRYKSAEVRDKLDAVRPDLPSDVQRFNLLRFSTTDEPLLRLRLSSRYDDLRDDYDLLLRKLKRPLERIPGVARVDLQGVEPYEVRIDLLPERIAAHNVNLGALSTQLQAVNFSTSAGLIDDSGLRYQVQPQGELNSLEELGALEVAGSGVRLRDIAEIRKLPKRQDYRRILNGQLAVGVDVYMERNANLVEVGRASMAEVQRIIDGNELPGIELIVIDDQAEGVSSSLGELSHAGWLGMGLSLILLYVFLRHWPSTLMVTLAVPICIAMTLGCMYFLGLTLNVLSMMGLLLGIGMLVDNAVVVVESIYQQREKRPEDAVGSAIEGTQYVALAVSAGTLTSIIVFLPIIFGGDNLMAIFLYHVAVPLTISLLCSWLVAITLIPMLAARVRPPQGLASIRMVERWKRGYAAMVAWTLRHRGWTVTAILLSVLSTVVPLGAVKTDFFGGGESREIRANFEVNAAYPLEQMERTALELQNFLIERKERYDIQRVYSYMQEGQGMGLWVQLTPEAEKSRLTSETVDLIRKEMPPFAIGKINFEGGGGGPGGGGPGGDGGGDSVSLRVVGDSQEQLQTLARTVVGVLARVEGLQDVRLDNGNEAREVQVRVDRERAAALGFSTQQVAQTIAIALRGVPLREFRTADGEVPTWLRFKDAETLSLDALKQVRMTRPDGTSVPLNALVTMDTHPSARQIFRENRRTGLTIKANLAPEATKLEIQPKIDAALKGVVFPAGYGFDYGRSFRQENEAVTEMIVNVMLALAMIFIVMAALFESLLYPLAILSGVLFSVTGVYWGFLFTGTEFSVMSMIGIMILIGVVVNNGIVLIEHVNNLRREGFDRATALVQAGAERLRPILITTGCTILGLLPLCLSTVQVGDDGPPYFPMARAIAFGLAWSTVITLLALPTVYAMLDDLGMANRRFWARIRGGTRQQLASLRQR